MSVPGIARKMLFDTARREGAEFTLFDEKNKDLFHTVKKNIVGGPSIIYHRKAVKGETKIRGGKVCQKVLGYVMLCIFGALDKTCLWGSW